MIVLSDPKSLLQSLCGRWALYMYVNLYLRLYFYIYIYTHTCIYIYTYTRDPWSRGDVLDTLKSSRKDLIQPAAKKANIREGLLLQVIRTSQGREFR